eukprot:jgi/Chrzof1/1727/Cz10g18230.t1
MTFEHRDSYTLMLLLLMLVLLMMTQSVVISPDWHPAPEPDMPYVQSRVGEIQLETTPHTTTPEEDIRGTSTAAVSSASGSDPSRNSMHRV